MKTCLLFDIHNGILIAKSKKHSKRFLIQIPKLDFNQAIVF